MPRPGGITRPPIPGHAGRCHTCPSHSCSSNTGPGNLAGSGCVSAKHTVCGLSHRSCGVGPRRSQCGPGSEIRSGLRHSRHTSRRSGPEHPRVIADVSPTAVGVNPWSSDVAVGKRGKPFDRCHTSPDHRTVPSCRTGHRDRRPSAPDIFSSSSQPVGDCTQRDIPDSGSVPSLVSASRRRSRDVVPSVPFVSALRRVGYVRGRRGRSTGSLQDGACRTSDTYLSHVVPLGNVGHLRFVLPYPDCNISLVASQEGD